MMTKYASVDVSSCRCKSTALLLLFIVTPTAFVKAGVLVLERAWPLLGRPSAKLTPRVMMLAPARVSSRASSQRP